MIKVLVVEDSPVVREFLVHVLSSDAEMEVIGTACDGAEALEAVERLKPDVITMDLHMPRMDGFEATRRIMETHPVPIVIVSGSSTAKEVATAFHAVEAGALAVVRRPAGMGHPEHEATVAELVKIVKLMSEVKVVKRWARPRREAEMPRVSPPVELERLAAEIRVVAIGASTGGPLALQTILSELPRDFSVPVLIVQHIAPGFTLGFAEWLAQTCDLPVRVATQGERILPGHVYIAPQEVQMKVEKEGTLWLTADAPENGLRPSVAYLFRSIASVYGPEAVGVLLTGMGKDGAQELKRMKEAGAVTIAQDKESSVVHGMPGEAISLEAATYVLSLNQLPAVLSVWWKEMRDQAEVVQRRMTMRSAKSSKNEEVEILIAEDSPTQAEQLKYVLEEQGYTVTVAANGEQALAAARERKPALIISDILMPGMDGYTLCKQVRSDRELEDTPVMLVTSLTGPHDILKGLECGADNFITKPYEEKYVLSRIQHILSNRQLPKRERVQFGAEVHFAGRKQFISAEQQQILGLLLSTYEEAVRINQELGAKKKELERSHQSLQALYRLAEGLNEATSEKTVLEKALERAMELPGVQAGWICLWEAEAGFRLAAARGLPPALEPRGAWQGDCLCRRQLLAGEFKQAAKVLECERLQQAGGDALGLRYHASVPLRSGERVVGVMNLAGTEQGLFRDEDLKTLCGVGNQIAVAIQRAHLLEQLERKVEERTAALTEEVAHRRQTEETLRRSETSYRTLFEAANDAIIIFEPEEEIILAANSRACDTYGFSQDELIGMSLKRLTKDVPRGEQQVGRLLQEGTGRNVETVHLNKDGQPLEMLVNASVIEYEGRKAILSINRDITERKRLEEQFRQSQKLEAIGQLAGGVAHDFNNLLGVIIGYSDLLLDSYGPEDPPRKKVEKIRKAADSAVSITRQLLAVGRKQVLETKVLDLNAVVTEMGRMLRRLIGEDIELVIAPSPELGRVEADPGQIEQIIMNLVVNARDAMPRGGRLIIGTGNAELDGAYRKQRPEVQPGPYVMLEVSDTGVGMDAEIQARIFEPFFTTKEKGKGTGLGLATVYGIVKQSGGYIWVYSEPGEGTTFKVYLPRVEAAVVAFRSGAVREKLARASGTVLLVEDAEPLRTLARELLEGCGYTVLEAKDGAEAMEVAGQHAEPIHLLLTDVVMPGMSGPELAERLTPGRPGMKVLYVSGYTNEAVNHRLPMKEGMAFLQKPFTRQALASKVRELLSTGEREAAVGSVA